VGLIDARGNIYVGVCTPGLSLCCLLDGETRGEEVVLSTCPAIFVACKVFFVHTRVMFCMPHKVDGTLVRSDVGFGYVYCS